MFKVNWGRIGELIPQTKKKHCFSGQSILKWINAQYVAAVKSPLLVEALSSAAYFIIS